MKFNFQKLFQRAKSNSTKSATYRIRVELSFLANFFVQYDKQPNVPIIKEFYATQWHTELTFPESYNVSFKVFVRNPSEIENATVSLSIENVNVDGVILIRKFDLENKKTNLDSEWFRISLY